MTITFEVSADIKKISESLINEHKKQIPFAAASALNNIAFRVQKQEKIKAKKEIDRPIPFTLRGFRVKKANKMRLESRVFIAPIQWEYLQHIVSDSVRYPKRKFIGVPVKDNVKINKYGNVTGKRKGLIKNKTMFIGKVKGISGVWQRGRVSKKGQFSSVRKKGDSSVRLLYRLKSQTRYERSFNYFKHAKKVIDAWFSKDLDAAMRNAIRTAK